MRLMMRIADLVAVACLLILAAPAARADLSWTVSLDTSRLAAGYTGPFGLDFEMVGSNGNTVTLSQFSFGAGGSAGPGPASLTGGASGELSSSVTLNDNTSFLSDFNEAFTPGSVLSFDLQTTSFSGAFPDSFSMVIFSSYAGYSPTSGPVPNVVPTTDPTGSDTLLTVNVNGPGSTTAIGYSSASGDIPAPEVNLAGSAVPEPPTDRIVVLVLAVAGTYACRRFRFK
jgi:hypothetical protein